MIKDLKYVKLFENEIKLIEKGWGFDVAYNVITQKFFYNSDNEIVEGYISYPKNSEHKLPVIIWNRGGNDKSGLLDDFLASGILGEIASWGYVVFASQYRKKDEFGGKEVNDILNLVEETKIFELSDTNNIGMEGWSRGGMMTYLTLTRTEDIKCCTVVAGISNLKRNSKSNPKLLSIYKRHFGVDDEYEFKKRIEDRSAVCWSEKICKRTNILFIHGKGDEKISYKDSKEIYEELSKINVNTKYELKLIDKGDHYLRKERKMLSGIRKKWFDSFLKIESI